MYGVPFQYVALLLLNLSRTWSSGGLIMFYSFCNVFDITHEIYYLECDFSTSSSANLK